MLHPFSRLFGLGDKPEPENREQEKESYNPDEVLQIPIAKIHPNRFQPRTVFSAEKIAELAQTLHTHGMIQPIVVRETEDGEYELIAGERRWRASQSLGWEKIPAIIREMTNTQTASVALIENLQREELSVIEEATAYRKLLDMHELTQEALAQRLGKSQSAIANKLRLLKLPESVQQAVLDKNITERHARALIALKDTEKMEKLLQEIIDEGLNVKQTEERIKEMKDPKEKKKPAPKKKKPKIKGVSKDMRIAMNTIRQSLDMVKDTGLDVETDEEDYDDYYQVTIKIPKNKQ
ncbi:nucleoid occlusion protein [Salimicrobium jeotgali]|uniref:nucleoid occlusion protein n=1 Tax=Salimicrobium jeotgali TaxID=1230341 RepID=UPI000C84293E|nr:nucleoid occlusion protein [Salimicrobium jeotgali]